MDWGQGLPIDNVSVHVPNAVSDALSIIDMPKGLPLQVAI
jgi:hypothetical protein